MDPFFKARGHFIVYDFSKYEEHFYALRSSEGWRPKLFLHLPLWGELVITRCYQLCYSLYYFVLITSLNQGASYASSLKVSRLFPTTRLLLYSKLEFLPRLLLDPNAPQMDYISVAAVVRQERDHPPSAQEIERNQACIQNSLQSFRVIANDS